MPENEGKSNRRLEGKPGGGAGGRPPPPGPLEVGARHALAGIEDVVARRAPPGEGYTGCVGVRNSEGISSLGSMPTASTISRLNSMAGDSAVTLGNRMACIWLK